MYTLPQFRGNNIFAATVNATQNSLPITLCFNKGKNPRKCGICWFEKFAGLLRNKPEYVGRPHKYYKEYYPSQKNYGVLSNDQLKTINS